MDYCISTPLNYGHKRNINHKYIRTLQNDGKMTPVFSCKKKEKKIFIIMVDFDFFGC